jgi:pyrimidine operon attenuation protein/uracil phosphoribosyltransferase
MSRKILNARNIDIIIQRLCFELIENHNDFSESALIGLQPRGIFFARKLRKALEQKLNKKVLYGELDITFYRDDFRKKELDIEPNEVKIDFLIEDKRIILVDDVLYTGRSVRSALDALNDFGRPKQVELLVLIDRHYTREFPIEPDYTGKKVDSRADDKVKVEWEEDAVWIMKRA